MAGASTLAKIMPCLSRVRKPQQISNERSQVGDVGRNPLAEVESLRESKYGKELWGSCMASLLKRDLFGMVSLRDPLKG